MCILYNKIMSCLYKWDFISQRVFRDLLWESYFIILDRTYVCI